MCKTKSKFSKHQNSHNFKAIGSSDLRLSQKLLTTGAHHPAKFQPPTPSGSKVIAKKAHLHSFQDHHIRLYSILPIGSFQDHYIKLHSTIGSFQDHYIRLYSNTHKFPFKTPIGAIVVVISVQIAKSDHFKTLDLVYFQKSWQVDSSFSSPQSSTGMQRTSNWRLTSGRVRSP